jgi:hypothetical protein
LFLGESCHVVSSDRIIPSLVGTFNPHGERATS